MLALAEETRVHLAGGETLHGAILVGAFHLAVHEVDSLAELLLKCLEPVGRGREIDILGLLDQRADPIGAPAFGESTADGGDNLVEA